MGKIAYLHASTSVAVLPSQRIATINAHDVAERTEQTRLDSGRDVSGLNERKSLAPQGEQISDAALYRSFRDDGDVAAFEALFSRHRNTVLAFVWALSGSRNIADDVSQHCWLRIIEADAGIGYQPMPGTSFKSYLLTMARNRYIDEHKRKHVETRSDSLDVYPALATSDSTAYESAEVDERSDAIDAAVATLPMEQRDVLAMWLQGYSIQEMMMSSGVPRDTVLSRKKYALKKLRRLLVTFENKVT